MRKYFLSIWAVALLALLSCTKEREVDFNSPEATEGIPFEIVACSAESKTVNDGPATKWAEGDAVNVFHAVAGTTNYINDGAFTVRDVENGKFTGTLASLPISSQSYDWYVYYPYNPDITSPENTSGGYSTVAGLTQFQAGNDNKAHLARLPLAGKVTTGAGVSTPTVSMKQLSAIIKVVVANHSGGSKLPVKRLVLSSSGNMAGNYYVNFADPENPVYTENAEGVGDSVKLNTFVSTGAAGQSTFYIAVKPFELSASSTITLKVNDYEKSVVLDADKAFHAGNIYPVTFDYDAPVASKDFKILVIGNSFSSGMLNYVKSILQAAGLNSGFSLYHLARGGASFLNWYDVYYGKDSSTYKLGKIQGNTINELNDVVKHKYMDGSEQKTGYEGTDNTGFVATLNADWDIILFQQVSTYSNDYTVWTKNGKGGYLKEYYDILHSFCPDATYGFVLVHSAHFQHSQNSEHSSELRWHHIAQSAQWMLDQGYVDFVVPYGTAVQNLRLTSLNDADDFTISDGKHLSSGLVQYAAGAAFFETLFAPMFGVSVLGNTYTNSSVTPGRGVVQITAENALLAQKAALWAVRDPYNLHNPEESESQDEGESEGKGEGSSSYDANGAQLPAWGSGADL